MSWDAGKMFKFQRNPSDKYTFYDNVTPASTVFWLQKKKKEKNADFWHLHQNTEFFRLGIVRKVIKTLSPL